MTPIVALKVAVTAALAEACAAGVTLDEAVGVLWVAAMNAHAESRTTPLSAPPREPSGMPSPNILDPETPNID